MDHGENAYCFMSGIYGQTVPALVNHPGHTAIFLGIWSAKGFLQYGKGILWTKGVLWYLVCLTQVTWLTSVTEDVI